MNHRNFQKGGLCVREWKQAWELSKIELKRQIMWLVFSGLLFILLGLLLGIGFPHYIMEKAYYQENNPGLYDLVFIFLFWIVPYWVRPKDFRYHMVTSDFWVNPYFIKLQELPIPNSVIIKSRFTTSLVQSIPFYALFLLFIYIVSGLIDEFMPVGTFISFSVIWLSFSIYAGFVFPASDAGDRISPLKLVLLYILFGGILVSMYILFGFVMPHGAVAWTMIFADRWPVLCSVLSILLAFCGMRYWMYYMKKTMNRHDYL